MLRLLSIGLVVIVVAHTSVVYERSRCAAFSRLVPPSPPYLSLGCHVSASPLQIAWLDSCRRIFNDNYTTPSLDEGSRLHYTRSMRSEDSLGLCGQYFRGTFEKRVKDES